MVAARHRKDLHFRIRPPRECNELCPGGSGAKPQVRVRLGLGLGLYFVFTVKLIVLQACCYDFCDGRPLGWRTGISYNCFIVPACTQITA